MDKKIETIELNQMNIDIDEDDNISVKYVSFDQNEPSMNENIPESSEYAVVYGTVKEYQNVGDVGKTDIAHIMTIAGVEYSTPNKRINFIHDDDEDYKKYERRDGLDHNITESEAVYAIPNKPHEKYQMVDLKCELEYAVPDPQACECDAYNNLDGDDASVVYFYPDEQTKPFKSPLRGWKVAGTALLVLIVVSSVIVSTVILLQDTDHEKQINPIQTNLSSASYTTIWSEIIDNVRYELVTLSTDEVNLLCKYERYTMCKIAHFARKMGGQNFHKFNAVLTSRDYI